MDETPVESGRPHRTTSKPSGTEHDPFQYWASETLSAMEEADSSRVDVYVRSMLPPPGVKESQTTMLEHLTGSESDTDASAPIQDVTVNVWGERLCRCEECLDTHVGRTMMETVRELLAWGEDYDATASEFFERTSQESAFTGNSYDGIVPPHVTAAIYIDEVLQGVFPCSFDGTPYSVQDFCEVIDGTADVDERPNAVDSIA